MNQLRVKIIIAVWELQLTFSLNFAQIIGVFVCNVPAFSAYFVYFIKLVWGLIELNSINH